jgi:hypothetical protein
MRLVLGRQLEHHAVQQRAQVGLEGRVRDLRQRGEVFEHAFEHSVSTPS